QRPNEIALADAFDVLESGSVAALTLHVVVDGALDAIPTGGRTAVGVASPVRRVAAETRILFARVRVQGIVGVRVLRPGPAALEVGVAVTTGGLLDVRAVVAEEARGRIRWWVERRAILVDDVVLASHESGGSDHR